jgi:hypothetical protein
MKLVFVLLRNLETIAVSIDYYRLISKNIDHYRLPIVGNPEHSVGIETGQSRVLFWAGTRYLFLCSERAVLLWGHPSLLFSWPPWGWTGRVREWVELHLFSLHMPSWHTLASVVIGFYKLGWTTTNCRMIAITIDYYRPRWLTHSHEGYCSG